MNGFYFSSTLMWDADERELFGKAWQNGFCGIELWAQHAASRKLDIQLLKQLKEETGTDILVHAKSWDLNYAALNDRVRAASVDEIKDSIDLAIRLGAKEVTVHPPRYTLQEDESARNRAYESIREFFEYAGRQGIRISMELMEHIPREMATSPESMYSIVRDLSDQLAYTVDLAHCLTEEEFFRNISRMKGVSKVHITNKAGSKLHTPLPDGDFSFDRIYPALEALNLPMVIEGYERGKRYEALDRNISYIRGIKEKYHEKDSSIFSCGSHFCACGLQLQ